MDNEEKAKIVNELYGSVHDPHNYDEKYYYQQAKETAAVTAIAMLRDGAPLADIEICINDWYGVEIPDHAMAILQAEARSDEEEEQLTGNRTTDLSPSKRPLSFKLSFFSSKQCDLPHVFQTQQISLLYS